MWTNLLILLAICVAGIWSIRWLFSQRPSVVFRIFSWFLILYIVTFAVMVVRENPEETSSWTLLRLIAEYLLTWPSILSLVLAATLALASRLFRRVGH